jgi:uncharacterized protein
MDSSESIRLVQECFAAVEGRDETRQAELFHPDAEFLWPSSLPYARRGLSRRRGFEATWDPFQPTAADRRLEPRVVASSGDEVVVLWQQRGVDAEGKRFQCPVLGLYEVRERKLVRAQMFYFDTTATARFLANATPPRRPGASRS